MSQESSELNNASSKGEIILYQTTDGRTSIDVKLENETVWLSSDQMAELFERDRTVIQRHIRNIYNEGELSRDITCAKFAHMGKDEDQTYVTEVFNLDVIISVGYRVKSKRGAWQLFGHVHSGPRSKTGKDIPRLSMLFPTQYDVGVDNNGFKPVSFNELKTIIQKQQGI